MENKKAFLLGENTVKIIIAVLCILILIGLLVVLYGIFKGKSQLDQAESHLNNIIQMAERADEAKFQPYVMVNPLGWHLFTFPGENKVCFCPVKTEWVWKEIDLNYWRETCENEGVCKETKIPITFDMFYYDYNKNVWAQYGLFLFDPRTIYVSKENGNVYIRDYNKGKFQPYMDKTLSLMSLDVVEQTKKEAIEKILIDAEKETSRKMAVIIGYKDKNKIEIIPNINIKSKIGRNFVVHGSKDVNTAAYLIVQRIGEE